jgi:hypothetical protein
MDLAAATAFSTAFAAAASIARAESARFQATDAAGLDSPRFRAVEVPVDDGINVFGGRVT